MHPFFTQSGRLGVYLLGWIPLTAILGGLLMLAGGLSLLEAAALAAPLGLLYAFLCLSSWYLCRAFPVDSARLLATASALAVASLVAASLWLLSGTTLAWVLALLPVFETLPDRLARAGPVVFLLGVLLYLLVLAMHYVLDASEAARDQERRAAELRTLAREAELQALRERLNPHFLFNSLNSIAALVAERPEEARSMCALLSDFLRTTLGMSERSRFPFAKSSRSRTAISPSSACASATASRCPRDVDAPRSTWPFRRSSCSRSSRTPSSTASGRASRAGSSRS